MPLAVIVSVLCFFFVPVSADVMLSFIIGTLMVITGMSFFNIGSESAMTPIGNRIGTTLTKTKKLFLILILSLVLGFAVTIAEPDLQVLANTVPHINNAVLLITVGVGVGLFLAVSMLRIITGVKLRWLLMVFYAAIFILASFTDETFLGVAFDSGGVTTGPMTVPFILALGVGVSNIRSDKKAEADSFGLVALCSIGPVLAVLILGFLNKDVPAEMTYSVVLRENTAQIGRAYIQSMPLYFKEMFVALLPIILIFLIFQAVSFKMPKRNFLKLCVGILYTYIGLVLFLTGVNVGFGPLGLVLGAELAAGQGRLLLVPLMMLLGWFIISAEPAVHVLVKQIDSVSAGAIPEKAITLSLSAAVSLAMGIAAVRVITGISLMWFLIPGYVLALAFSFFVPDIYTAIAFDSGGVASGPMTSTFMLQLLIGAGLSLNSNVLTDAFGMVALVAMMPLLSIQIVGLIYSRRMESEEVQSYCDDEIIELWEA